MPIPIIAAIAAKVFAKKAVAHTLAKEAVSKVATDTIAKNAIKKGVGSAIKTNGLSEASINFIAETGDHAAKNAGINTANQVVKEATTPKYIKPISTTPNYNINHKPTLNKVEVPKQKQKLGLSTLINQDKMNGFMSDHPGVKKANDILKGFQDGMKESQQQISQQKTKLNNYEIVNELTPNGTNNFPVGISSLSQNKYQ